MLTFLAVLAGAYSPPCDTFAPVPHVWPGPADATVSADARPFQLAPEACGFERPSTLTITNAGGEVLLDAAPLGDPLSAWDVAWQAGDRVTFTVRIEPGPLDDTAIDPVTWTVDVTDAPAPLADNEAPTLEGRFALTPTSDSRVDGSTFRLTGPLARVSTPPPPGHLVEVRTDDGGLLAASSWGIEEVANAFDPIEPYDPLIGDQVRVRRG